jgi:hypothetical protein
MGFVGATRDEYLSHMNAAHPGKFTDAQLGVLADRNGRIVGPLFKSCPLCGIEEVNSSIEDHIVGHLRFLALKSLPSYGEDVEGLEDADGQENSLATSRPQSRSTIKLEMERSGPMTFHDSGDRPSIGLEHGPSRYEAWGGFRNYIAQFPEGQRLPIQTTSSSLLTDATETSLPPQISHFEPPPLHPRLEGPLMSYEPSTEFNEESLFDEVSYKERRLFEWGFIPDAHGSAEALEGDPVVRGFLKFDPDCAICNAPAFQGCDCEARGFDIAVRQAEQRILAPKFNRIRAWVRGQSQDAVLRDFNAHLQQRRESSANVAHPKWTKASPTAQTAPSKQAENEILPPTHQEVNELWKAATQKFPDTLEYYFGLVDFSLPPDDDLMVLDPPLSALAGLRKPGPKGKNNLYKDVEESSSENIKEI